METIVQTEPRAIKEHKCDWCGGIIKVGEIYDRQFLKDGDIYVWKSHTKCLRIAVVLRMFDNCDEGLDSDTFMEIIKDAFCKLWQKKDLEYYESKDFPVTTFLEDLDFVCKQYLIQI